jgi:hypothetical protein
MVKFLEKFAVFFIRPLILLETRTQIIAPTLAALTRSEWNTHANGNIRPVPIATCGK